MNAKLLVPWLLADERPNNLVWPTDCLLCTLQVKVKFSFVYCVSHGVFERLSCCHQHCSYICHWRSGLIQCGCVRMLAQYDDNERHVTMTTCAPDAGQNLFRLFHVLLPFVNEMETILVTIPGILLDRCITMKIGLQSTIGLQRKLFGPLYDVDDVQVT